MTLRQLTLFRAVAQHLSFTRAAAELSLTQPAVSIQIKQLENHIGTPMFEQVGKRIFLTDAGDELYKACGDIFARIEALELSLNELQGSIKGKLKLSVVTTAAYFLPYLLKPFLERYPEVKVRLNVTNRNTLLKRLSDNEDDLVIMGQVPEQLNVTAKEFLESPLVVLAPAEHPLVAQSNIPLAQIAEENILVREPGSGTRAAMERCFAAQELELKNNMELGSTEAVKQGVMAGMGISVLSQHTVTLELAAGTMKILDVEGFPLKRHWYIAHLVDKQLSLVARTFLEFVISQADEMTQLICKRLREGGQSLNC
jgi:DNA-binding transcriptional LysR family regulator